MKQKKKLSVKVKAEKYIYLSLPVVEKETVGIFVGFVTSKEFPLGVKHDFVMSGAIFPAGDRTLTRSTY